MISFRRRHHFRFRFFLLDKCEFLFQVVDRVLPMLPENLSNGICSLKPKVDRLTRVVVMRFTLDGKMTFDNNALFRQEDILPLRDMDEEDANEIEAKEKGLSFIESNGLSNYVIKTVRGLRAIIC